MYGKERERSWLHAQHQSLVTTVFYHQCSSIPFCSLFILLLWSILCAAKQHSSKSATKVWQSEQSQVVDSQIEFGYYNFLRKGLLLLLIETFKLAKMLGSQANLNNATTIKTKKCSVCGDKAVGMNYNGLTCVSCRTFFTRSATKTGVRLLLYTALKLC